MGGEALGLLSQESGRLVGAERAEVWSWMTPGFCLGFGHELGTAGLDLEDLLDRSALNQGRKYSRNYLGAYLCACVMWRVSGMVSFVSSVGSSELEIGNGV